MPFYAGSLRQGYRTLVVFCLPTEALGIGVPIRQKSQSTALTSSTSINSSFSSSHAKTDTFSALTRKNITQH